MKKIITIICLTCILSFGLLKNVSHAQNMEVPFGGMLLAYLGPETCTCGGNSHLILDFLTWRVISLYRSPSSIFYLNYNPDYAKYQLGTYSFKTEDCKVESGTSCEVLQVNDGDYGRVPGTGTSQQ